MAFNWTCPYCDRAQSVTHGKFHISSGSIEVSDVDGGPMAIERTAIACANPDCRKMTLSIRVGKNVGGIHATKVTPDNALVSMRIMPFGSSKSQPDFVPQAIRDDYQEACLIKSLSPKASATLARRAIQGMIRDFCGISRATLNAEIKALRAAIDDGSAPRAVSIESVDAIDHVRKVGNIGAHMEKDIDVIVDVDPGEAQTLIDLIELLIKDWYIDRYNRQQRLGAVSKVSDDKALARIPHPSIAALLIGNSPPSDGEEAAG